MAEETDLSRTEPASSQRLHQARLAGDVPRSAELTAWVVLLSALGTLGWLAPRLLGVLQNLIEMAFLHATNPLSPIFLEAASTALWTALPVFIAIFVAALLAPMLLSGWVYAPHITQGDLTRASPFKALSRLSSTDSLFDGLQALMKWVLVAAAIGWALTSGWPGLQSLAGGDMPDALRATAAWVGRGMLALAAALTLVVALDAGWRWWRYLRRHAMTWQEVLAEAQESEGSPEMRAQLRGRQQQAGQGQSPLPNPDETAKQSTKPASGQVAAYPPEGEGANVGPRTINEVIG